MTVPTQQIVEVMNELTLSTLRNMDGKIYDNITRNNALFSVLNKKNKIKILSGGTAIQKDLMFASGEQTQRYFGYDPIPVSPSTNITGVVYPFYQYVRSVTMSGREIAMNRGKEELFDLWGARLEAKIKELMNDICADMYSDGSLPNQIGGLQFLVGDNPNTGVIGGIDAATNVNWRNIAVAPSTPIDVTNIEEHMDDVYTQLVDKNYMPDLIIADNKMWTLFKRRLTSIQRITDADKGNLGFPTLEYMGIPVVLDGGFQGFENDGTAIGGAPTEHMYFLNTDFIELNVMRDFEYSNVLQSPDQDGIVMHIYWMGGMSVMNRRLQGLLRQGS